MVAQPISRILFVGLALLAGAATANAQGTVVVVDLTRGDGARRAATWKAIAATAGLEAGGDAALIEALAGKLEPESAGRGAQAAASAAELAAKKQCSDAGAAARAAIIELAAAQALGADVLDAVKRARTAQLICALAAGDEAEAFIRARDLHRLGQVDAPPGVSDADWARFPELDAEANVGLAEVVIESKLPGAEVWVDFVKVGPARATVYLDRRSHVIAASVGGAVAAKTIQVSGWSQIELLAPSPSSRWTAVNDLVDQIRAGKRVADARTLAELMAAAGAGYAVVLIEGGVSEAWIADQSGARMLGRRRSDAQAVDLVAQVARPGRAPDPDRELLRETEAERAARRGRKDGKTEWWVYAAVIGAAAVGASIIVLSDVGTDRQRFEIVLP